MPPKITYEGKDLNFTNVPLNYQMGVDTLPAGVMKGKSVGLGMPITVRFLREIVTNYLTNQGGNLSSYVAGTFGKESILHILSQENCDAIRWVLARVNDNGTWRNTVALFGIDKDGNPLPTVWTGLHHPLKSTTTHQDTDPVIYEVSGGVTVEELSKELNIPFPLPSPVDEKSLTKGFDLLFSLE